MPETMEDDKFKGFIDENRQQFDDLKASDRNWEQIEQALPAKKVFSSWGFVAAAAVFFVAMIAVSILQQKRQNVQPVAAVEEEKIESLADVSPEMAEAEYYYEEQILAQKAMIEAYDLDAHPEFASFIQEYERVDSVYRELLTEINQRGVHPKVIDELIINYKIKIKILEMLRTELDKHLENSEKTSQKETKTS